MPYQLFPWLSGANGDVNDNEKCLQDSGVCPHLTPTTIPTLPVNNKKLITSSPRFSSAKNKATSDKN